MSRYSFIVLEENNRGHVEKIEILKRNLFRRKLGKTTVVSLSFKSSDGVLINNWIYPNGEEVGYWLSRKLNKFALPLKVKPSPNWVNVYIGERE